MISSKIVDENKSNKIYNISEKLILFIIKKYNIKSYDEFSCEIMKELAQELKIFENKNGEK